MSQCLPRFRIHSQVLDAVSRRATVIRRAARAETPIPKRPSARRGYPPCSQESWIHYAERWYARRPGWARTSSRSICSTTTCSPTTSRGRCSSSSSARRRSTAIPSPTAAGFWALTKYDDVLAVLRDTKTYSSEVGGAATIEDLPEDVLAARRNFLEFDPPKHGRYRRLISTQFTPGAVSRYEEWLRELVRYRLDTVAAAGRVRPRARARGADPDPRAGPHPRSARGDPAAPDRPRRPAPGRHRPRVRRRPRLRRRARGVPLQAVRLARGPTSCARSGASSTPTGARAPATTSSA